MPRQLPPLAADFAAEAVRARSLPSQLETLGALPLASLELSYELAYLRIFLAWEVFQEQAFLRLLCGYTRANVQEPLVPGQAYAATLSNAEALILGNQQYKLWHNPDHVVKRAQRFFNNGNFELVISSRFTRLERLAAVRHRIAHSQKHAEQQFNAATMAIAVRRYRGGRPGRFLRDWDRSGQTPCRWIDTLARDLTSLAQQISP